MAITSLESFITQVTTRFDAQSELAPRLEHARTIAKRYKFECPELVLFYTHPEIAKLPLSARCKKVNITEEQFAILAAQPGFQRFTADWQRLHTSTLTAQAQDKVGEAIQDRRYKYDKFGNETEQFDVELEVLKQQATREAPAPQVNVQVNNLFERAREQVRARAVQATPIQDKESV